MLENDPFNPADMNGGPLTRLATVRERDRARNAFGGTPVKRRSAHVKGGKGEEPDEGGLRRLEDALRGVFCLITSMMGE